VIIKHQDGQDDCTALDDMTYGLLAPLVLRSNMGTSLARIRVSTRTILRAPLIVTLSSSSTLHPEHNSTITLHTNKTGLGATDCPKTVEELIAPTRASSTLVNRIARKLATMRMAAEIGPASYAPNRITHVLMIPEYGEGIRSW
jgi:hypothetical protein